MYFDDGIVALPEEVGAITARGWVRDTLAKAGWVCNEAKSTWLPTHRLSWLGLTLDLELGLISVPDRKIEVLRGKLLAAMEQPMLRARFIASLVDRIIAMSLALGSVARYMTRALYALLLTTDMVRYATHNIRGKGGA